MVQLTPPGSDCSIIIGTGVSSAEPGSVQGLHLVAFDVEAARAELVAARPGPVMAMHVATHDWSEWYAAC